MKKLITVILILALLIPAAALADIPDVSVLSDEELAELNRTVQAELFKRGAIFSGVRVPAGVYTIGDDIPAGTYRIVLNAADEWTTCAFYLYSVYENIPSYDMVMGFSNSKEIGKLELNDGNRIEFDNELYFFTYTGVFN